jgi:Protein NO VEIN, C-terminal
VKEWSRLEVERRAIEIVIDLENRDKDNEGYKAIDVHELKLGYDVVVIPHKITMFEYDEKSYANVTKKFIEIKASKRDSEDFVITAQEIEKGEKFTNSFFLYRVTNTMSKKPVIYIVDRPLEQYHDAIDEKTVKIVQDWKTKEGLHYIEVPYYPK